VAAVRDRRPRSVILVAGEALVDLIVGRDGSISAIGGGSSFNVARTIARLGVKCGFLSCLSDDLFGRMLRARLVDDGVELSLVRPTTAPTTLALAELDPSGDASYRFYLDGTSSFGLNDPPDQDVLAASAALHVGSLGLVVDPMASTLTRMVAGAPESLLVMVDPNCRPGAGADRATYTSRLREILRRADVVKASREDLAYLFPGERPAQVASNVLELGPTVVLLTDGPGPVLIISANGEELMPVPPANVVDTVGAGDAFGGAFLAWWASHGLGRDDLRDPDSVREAVRSAIQVARMTTERRGADPPTADEVAAVG
jgi:fructokinase